MGGGSTQWEGSAFHCPSSMNEIILRHSQYTVPGGTSDTCNNGDIVGKSVGVQGRSYTSQLSVTVSRDLSDNVTIQCTHNADQDSILVGISSLVTVSGTSPISLDCYLLITININCLNFQSRITSMINTGIILHCTNRF